MRKENPLIADMFPAGKYTCKTCGDQNLAGENFRLDMRVFGVEHLCPDCYKEAEEQERNRKAVLYSSGEEKPTDTEEVICPWCGYEYGDSWEMEDSDDEHECEECGKIFSYERHYEITYSSNRVEE